jgi:hypothetical protein
MSQPRHTAADVARARWRPPEHRTPIPAVGDRVIYRAVDDGPTVGAIVLEVQDMTHPGNAPARWPDPRNPPFDPNCWQVRTASPGVPVFDEEGLMVVDPHPDTWPTLLLKVDGQASHVQTREARLPGSAGWLPVGELP